jgi:nitroimidazol reductase NimA-like FMN-containing flavoprotein (pyridoxamine 5'-phosphate oxidase superfamily)
MKPAQHPLTAMRRSHQAQDAAWIAVFLQRAPFGTLATALDDQPFQHTNLFAYDPAAHALYCHLALEGRTISNLAANPKVCLSFSQMGRLLPSTQDSIEFGVEYASVVVFGDAVVVSDAAEKEHGLRLLLDKYFPHLRPGVDYQAITPEELVLTAVVRVDIQAWSGKQAQAPADFPGAFTYGQHPGAGTEQEV